MSAVYLIRHGMTEANEKHLYCGSSDLPLSETGVEELKKLTYRIENARFITSGMKRTEDTLEILFGKVPHSREPRFREMDFGLFELCSYEELKDDPAYQAWISGDNEAKAAPNGESGVQMQKRALEAFSELREDGQNVVVVTHGGVIAAIMAHLFPGENKNRYQWQPCPGHGYTVFQDRYLPMESCD